MAKQLSIKEKLEAARRGGAATSGGESAPPPAPEVAAEAPAAVAKPAPAPPANVPTPSSLGRPLTLKEKLAAAKAGGAPPAAGAPKAAVASPAVESEAPVVEGTKSVASPAPSLGRPLTLKEKLAAAKSGGSTPSAGAAASAAKSPGAAKPATVVTAKRELPPLDKITDPKDLAEALRQSGAKKTKDLEDAAKAKSAPAAKSSKPKEERPSTVLPKPTKTQIVRSAAEMTRRTMFSALGVIIIGWAAFVGASVMFTQMLVRFMFPNVLAEPPSTVKVGLPSNFEPESVNDRFKAEAGFWIVRSTRFNGQDVIYALQSVCTHLGCPPNWLAGEQKFKCPCHGSGFYISGVNFEGPAPRPLERFKVSLTDDGQMMVDKSQKFQQELGQWSDPDSYLNA